MSESVQAILSGADVLKESKDVTAATDSSTGQPVATNSEPEPLLDLNLRGLSFLEMSQQLSSIDSSSPPPDELLDSSDFFNSKGELNISGMSQWSSDSDDDNEVNSAALGLVAAKTAEDEDVSDASTASTESITPFKPNTEVDVKSEIDDVNATNKAAPEKSIEHWASTQTSTSVSSPPSTSAQKSGPKNKSVRFRHSTVDFENNSVPNKQENGASTAVSSEEYYWSEPVKDDETFRAVVHNISSYGSDRGVGAFHEMVQKTQLEQSAVLPKGPNYGVRIYPGLQGLNVMNTSSTSGWRILPGTENEQIMSRAPNFRTPGGYKPPLEEKVPRNLTDDEIAEEVRQMYAEDAERDFDSQFINARSANSSHMANSPADGFEKRKPSVKRKLFQADVGTGGAGESASKSIETVNTFPNAGQVEVIEQRVLKARSYVCGSPNEDVEDVYSPRFRENTSSAVVNSLSDVQFTGDISRCLPRQHKSKRKENGLNLSSQSRSQDTRETNLAALDNLWHQIQETKKDLEADMRARVKIQGVSMSENPQSPERNITFRASTVNSASTNLSGASEAEKTVPTQSSTKRNLAIASKVQKLARRGGKQIRGHSRGKYIRSVRSPRQKQNSKTDLDLDTLNSDLDSLELSSILHEAQLEESDLDEILSQIQEYPMPGHLFEESEAPEELTSALQQLQINDWAKAGASEYVDKFHEEKFKRQQCEKEILQVQKELLEQRERIAVLEGLLKSKEAAVVKSTNLWEALVRKWKTHEAKCKKTLQDLETGQKVAKLELEERKLRLNEYEAEMGKALKLTEEFKSKNDSLIKELQHSAKLTSAKTSQLELNVEQLTDQVHQGKAEKEATVRALRECQSKLDEMSLQLDMSRKDLLASDEKLNSTAKLADNLSKENDTLKDNLSQLTTEKLALDCQLNRATENLKSEKVQKELLETTLNSRLAAQLKDQADKLHEYYNSRMQDILKVQTNKMVQAEMVFVKRNEKKMLELEEVSSARILEAESRFKLELETIKNKYESEVALLKRENAEKGKLIGAVSRQLQSFQNGNEDKTTEAQFKNSTTHSSAKSRNHVKRGTSSGPGTFDNQIQALSESTVRDASQPEIAAQSNLEFESDDMKRCIAALVNAYKEKNS